MWYILSVLRAQITSSSLWVSKYLRFHRFLVFEGSQIQKKKQKLRISCYCSGFLNNFKFQFSESGPGHQTPVSSLVEGHWECPRISKIIVENGLKESELQIFGDFRLFSGRAAEIQNPAIRRHQVAVSVKARKSVKS